MGDIVFTGIVAFVVFTVILFLCHYCIRYSFDYDPECGWHDWKYDCSVGSMNRFICSKCGKSFIDDIP